MSAWLWIPVLAVALVANAWFSVKNQQVGGWYFYASWFPVIGLVWALVSRYSKDLLLDGVIFDAVLFVSFTGAMIHFTSSWAKLGWVQYLGLGCILTGLFLFRVK